MTRMRRDVLLGLVLATVTFFAALYGVNESMAGGEGSGVPRLICPLH
jgi:hypothetical protein